MWRSNGERSNVPGPFGIVASRFQRALEDEAALKSTIDAHRQKILRDIPNTADRHGGSSSSKKTSTHRIMNEHVEDWRRKDQIARGTPFVSASMSLFWVIANGIKAGTTDIYISIIRVKDIDPLSLFIVSRHVEPGNAFTFSDQSQEVLVHGLIPRAALISTFTLANLLAAAPLWVPEHKLFDDYYGGEVACRVYAVQWAEAFQKQTDNERARHGVEMIRWVWHMLSFDHEGLDRNPDEDDFDVFQLSLYLYRWPFRRHPGVGTTAPSIQACKKIILAAMSQDGMSLPSAEDEDGTSEEDSSSEGFSSEDSGLENGFVDRFNRMKVGRSVT